MMNSLRDAAAVGGGCVV